MTTMLSQSNENKKVAIIDDDSDLAEETSWEIEEAGYPCQIIEGPFDNVDVLISRIKEECHYAVCDHRLSNGAFANFPGSKLVAHLYDIKIPALLVTQFTMDEDVSIREYRAKIPVVLSRSRLNALNIQKGIKSCQFEIEGKVPKARKSYRTLIEIAYVDRESSQEVVDAFIPGWNSHRAVRFPVSLIKNDIPEIDVEPGMCFLAHVNLGALQPEDLYFKNFELAPEPSEDDGLA